MVDNFKLSEESKPTLTAREKEILQRICIGQSSKEIATHFKLSVTTVEDYRKSMLRKTKVKNTPELVDYAHRNGLV
jgi:DNA-binding CsgD family transcriptional regulator